MVRCFIAVILTVAAFKGKERITLRKPILNVSEICFNPTQNQNAIRCVEMAMDELSGCNYNCVQAGCYKQCLIQYTNELDNCPCATNCSGSTFI